MYRYSTERVLAYLRTKAERLSQQDVSEMSRTLTRSLAKDGFMADGKNDFLRGEYHVIPSLYWSQSDMRLAARLRAACDLVSQYLSRDIYEQLLASFEYVCA